MNKTDKVIEILKTWYAKLNPVYFSNCYVFGSLIYEEGNQFDPNKYESDVDIIIKLSNEILDASDRASACIHLRTIKPQLEIDLLSYFGKDNAGIPVTSIIPVTQFEIAADIHKSGNQEFFSVNSFMDIHNLNKMAFPKNLLPVTQPGMAAFPEPIRLAQIMRTIQSFRNSFLGVSANQKHKVDRYDGGDTFPKDISRLAATLLHLKEIGENEASFDINEGIEFMLELIKEKEKLSTDKEWVELHKKVKIRSGRGSAELNRRDLLYLHELLYENAHNYVDDFFKPTTYYQTKHHPSKLVKRKKINCFKLFFYRHKQFEHIKTFSIKTGIKYDRLVKLEHPVAKYTGMLDVKFRLCKIDELEIIERTLGITPNTLTAGQEDDFDNRYLTYYTRYKRFKITKGRTEKKEILPLFDSKIVFFDFDGTLTSMRTTTKTTWEQIWVALKYDLNDCYYYHQLYDQGKITHQKWCDITRDKFKDRRLTENTLLEIASQIKLIDGLQDMLEELAKSNVEMYIVSGSIKQVIELVLGDFKDYFNDIRANLFIFNKEDGMLEHIKGTLFDFENKSIYISRVLNDHSVAQCEALFVGNDQNDEFAYRSGVHTLLVNPASTNPRNKAWNYCIRNMSSLTQIIPYALPNKKGSNKR